MTCAGVHHYWKTLHITFDIFLDDFEETAIHKRTLGVAVSTRRAEVGTMRGVAAHVAPRGQSTSDWHLVAYDVAYPKLTGVPGVRLGPCRRGEQFYEIHRSHLPLLAGSPRRSEETDQSLDKITAKLGWTLRPYQHVARNFIRERRGTLLADQQRLGKTATAIASHDESEGQFVVVAPLATRGVWLSWMKKRWPDVEPSILTGRKLEADKLRDHPLVFVHYDIIKNWQSLGYLHIGTLVFDEAHLLSSSKTLRWQAAALLGSQAKRVIACTGTPTWNRPEGIFNILSIISGGWGSWKEFTARYASAFPGAYGWACGRPSNEQEFRLRLTEVMIRREWKDVYQNLPEITRPIELVDVSPDKLLELDRLAQVARESTARRTTVGEIAHLRKLLGGLKWKRGAALARELMVSGEKVVLWVWHKSVGKKLVRSFDNVGVTAAFISGDASASTRDEALDLFRRMKQPAALILTMGVGQVGIDLSAASHAIFVEQDWTPTVVAQAEYRTYSPTRPMSITHIVADHWLDRRVVAALVKKCKAAAQMGMSAAETELQLLEQALGQECDAETELLDLFS